MKHRHVPQPVLGLATAFAVVALVLGVAAAQAAPAAAASRRVYFKSPEAAMRYLASAYNRGDVAALKKVTTPRARRELLEMRAIATDLSLRNCAHSSDGTASCEFDHGYPKAMSAHTHGEAHFKVAPARKYGWYMTVMEDCG